jgi:hypothetical protein
VTAGSVVGVSRSGSVPPHGGGCSDRSSGGNIGVIGKPVARPSRSQPETAHRDAVPESGPRFRSRGGDARPAMSAEHGAHRRPHHGPTAATGWSMCRGTSPAERVLPSGSVQAVPDAPRCSHLGAEGAVHRWEAGSRSRSRPLRRELNLFGGNTGGISDRYVRSCTAALRSWCASSVTL